MMSPKKGGRSDPSDPILSVCFHEQTSGSMGQSGADLWFQYTASVAARADTPAGDASAISVRLPVQTAPYDHATTLVYFDNLLTETDTRDEIARAQRRDRADVAGLLGAVGAECAGAVAVWPTNADRPAPSYRALASADVEAIFDERHGERLTQRILESQQAMSGAQRKLVLRRDGTTWLLPIAGAPSTHLLKRSSGRYEGLVANELACLHLFAALGLPVPDAEPMGPAADWSNGTREPRLLVVTRFDRIPDETAPGWRDATIAVGGMSRLHQEDLCQITGRRPAAKYQANGGPTLRDLAEVVRRYTVSPEVDLAHALTAAIANVCLGNGDAHGKNFSLLTDAAGQRRLAPFYDIVSTDVYETLTPTFSMRVGHADRATGLAKGDIARLAKDFQVTASGVRRAMEHVTSTLAAHVTDALHTVEQRVGVESPILPRIEALVRGRVRQLQALLV